MSVGLALVGYGKMGKLVERLAPEYGFEVLAKFDDRNNARGEGLSQQALRGVEVAIEFTTPEAAPGNVRGLAALGLNCVCGTTGWYAELPRVEEVVRQQGTGLVWAANFSIGVNLFLQAVAHTAALFAKQAEYEAWGWEIHHSQKVDAPSGTLKKLAEEMKRAGYEREISLSASRAGTHAGTHEIGFDSSVDTITLRHTARSREGFARGALKAARWVVGKRGVYPFAAILGHLDAADFVESKTVGVG
jgi:4-hydroxy-tetrahydrodipicolinate reductase